MRTKRSADAKKPVARADKPAAASTSDAAPTIAAAPRKVTTWVAGIDGLSMGIAGAAIVAAGLLVAAYRPPQPAETSVETAAVTQAAATTTGAPDARRTAAPSSSSVGETPSAANWQPAPLTITGCLERNADAFRLTDTAGIGAPKSRSWKSGFLKKNASSINVIDSDRRAHLQDHLGQRVSVTGTMVNKEIQVGTLKLIAESCGDKTKV